MQNGYIFLHRKLLDSPVFSSELGLKVWIWCLLKSSFQERDIYIGRQKVHLEPGQFIYGRISASEQLGIAESTVRNWMSILEKDSYIDIKATNKYSIISIKNWEHYQKKDSRKTTDRQTDDEQMDTNNKDKKVKNDKNINIYMSEFNKLFERQFRVTAGRTRKLKTRLETYSMDQILKSLENLSKSPFHRGVNDRGWQADPDFLIRNDEQIDKWLNKDMNEAKQLSKLSRKAKSGQSKITRSRL